MLLFSEKNTGGEGESEWFGIVPSFEYILPLLERLRFNPDEDLIVINDHLMANMGVTIIYSITTLTCTNNTVGFNFSTDVGDIFINISYLGNATTFVVIDPVNNDWETFYTTYHAPEVEEPEVIPPVPEPEPEPEPPEPEPDPDPEGGEETPTDPNTGDGGEEGVTP